MAESPYKPSEWGKLFHSLPYEYVLGAGAAGPGKSWALLMDPMAQISVEARRCNLNQWDKRWIPRGGSKGRALHLRRTFPRLATSMSRSRIVFPQVDPGVRQVESGKIWTFSSGFTFEFGHCENPGDWEKYVGNEYTHISFDEAVEFTEEQFDQITMRLRTGDPVLVRMMKVRLCSNPSMTLEQGDAVTMLGDPFWVRRLFVDPFPQGKVVLRKPVYNRDGSFRAFVKRFYLPATIDDNPDPIVREEYKTRLLSAKPHIRKALLEGDWYYTPGAFYSDVWNPRIHTCEPFRIPDDWKWTRSMDWGFKKPGCIYWWAQDPDGTLYAVFEEYFQGKLDREMAARVREIESSKIVNTWRNGGSQITGPADTQLWERRGDSGKTKAETFAELGVRWVPADKADRVANAQLFYGRLKEGEQTDVPGIVFFNTCHKALTTIPTIRSHTILLDAPADGGDDHAHDAILYECAYASRYQVGVSRAEMADQEDATDDAPGYSDTEDRGAFGYG